MSHEVFPPLSPEAERVLREAMKRCERRYGAPPWDNLMAIADSLHIPPPPPPTLAQAREADLDTPEGKAAVRDFLATLVEWVQP